jgi:hypothetical protein
LNSSDSSLVLLMRLQASLIVSASCTACHWHLQRMAGTPHTLQTLNLTKCVGGGVGVLSQ